MQVSTFIFILFHQTVVAKKHTNIHKHTITHTNIQYIRTYTINVYRHTTVYVEAIELHYMADTLFHSLDKYKPNLTLCSRSYPYSLNCHGGAILYCTALIVTLLCYFRSVSLYCSYCVFYERLSNSGYDFRGYPRNTDTGQIVHTLILLSING